MGTGRQFSLRAGIRAVAALLEASGNLRACKQQIPVRISPAPATVDRADTAKPDSAALLPALFAGDVGAVAGAGGFLAVGGLLRAACVPGYQPSDDLGSGCSQGRWANDRVQLPGIGVLRDRGSQLADEGARLLAVHLHRLGGQRKGARDSAVLIAVRRDLVRGLQALLHSRGARAVETGLEGRRAHLRRLVCPAQRGLRARHLAEAGVVRAQRTRSRS